MTKKKSDTHIYKEKKNVRSKTMLTIVTSFYYLIFIFKRIHNADRTENLLVGEVTFFWYLCVCYSKR